MLIPVSSADMLNVDAKPEQDKQSTYNATLRRVLATTVAVEKQ
jgi:hypothetical protein